MSVSMCLIPAAPSLQTWRDTVARMGGAGLRVAVVCSSNMNRSMEAHARLANKGYNVLSFGTGDKIKLPGPSASQPNVYEFGTLYSEIWADLAAKDEAMYKQTGILHMLDRNRTIKPAPERLQDSERQFDLILTAEERVFDQVLLLLLLLLASIR